MHRHVQAYKINTVVPAALMLWMRAERIRAKNCPNILGVHRHLSDRH